MKICVIECLSVLYSYISHKNMSILVNTIAKYKQYVFEVNLATSIHICIAVYTHMY